MLVQNILISPSNIKSNTWSSFKQNLRLFSNDLFSLYLKLAIDFPYSLLVQHLDILGGISSSLLNLNFCMQGVLDQPQFCVGVCCTGHPHQRHNYREKHLILRIPWRMFFFLMKGIWRSFIFCYYCKRLTSYCPGFSRKKKKFILWIKKFKTSGFYLLE